MKIALFEFDLERYPICLQLEYALDKLTEGHEVTWYRPKQTGWLNLDFKFSRLVNKIIDANNLSYALNQLISTFENFEVKHLQSPSMPYSHEVESESIQKAWQEVSVRLRDSAPCSSHDQSLANKFRMTYSKLYFQAKKILSQENFDEIVVFNGRFLCHNAIWQSAKDLGLRIVFLERFNLDWNTRYFVFDQPVHSSVYRANVMKSFLETHPDSHGSKVIAAKSWFENRIFNSGSSFTADQSQTFKRPKEVKTVISFFHSSEDELFTIGLQPIYWKNQFEAINSISKYVSSRNDVRLFVRLHPNLRYKSSREQKRWRIFAERIGSEKVKFIFPEESTKTYSLLLQSDKVLTFGSTIGVEASWLRIPSGLMSSALHRELKVCETINCEAELFNFLDGNWNYQVSRFDLYAYSFFLKLGGQSFTYLKVNTNGEQLQDPIYSYAGRSLGSSRLLSGIKRIEGFMIQLSRRMRSINCQLDHFPYTHDHIAG